MLITHFTFDLPYQTRRLFNRIPRNRPADGPADYRYRSREAVRSNSRSTCRNAQFSLLVPLRRRIIVFLAVLSRTWERFIQQTFTNRPNAKSKYVMLRSEQLVGSALIVMIKEELTPVVKNVEGASKKVCLSRVLEGRISKLIGRCICLFFGR